MRRRKPAFKIYIYINVGWVGQLYIYTRDIRERESSFYYRTRVIKRASRTKKRKERIGRKIKEKDYDDGHLPRFAHVKEAQMRAAVVGKRVREENALCARRDV